MNQKTFFLIKQLPEPEKTKTKGYLDVDSKTKTASFWTSDGQRIAILERAEIKSANSIGIVLGGFEATGKNNTYIYQEWYLPFIV